MKKTLLFLAMLAITTMATAQIKILPAGNVAIGGNGVYNNDCKLQVNSGANNIVLSDYNGTNIGSNRGQIDFWHPEYHWNKVKFKNYALSSDSTLKMNIKPIKNASATLKQIKTYSYSFKSDTVGMSDNTDLILKQDYGVLAQEIEEVLPDLVDTVKGAMFVNYNAFIGILIKGFNEQQTLIEKQQMMISTLQTIVSAQELDLVELKSFYKAFYQIYEQLQKCCGIKGGSGFPLPEELQPLEDEAILYQNAPNPFTSNTEISYYLPETTTQAILYIYNLQGIELQSYLLTETGFHTVTISGSELPAGMYLYTLVVNNQIIDTKRMILTK